MSDTKITDFTLMERLGKGTYAVVYRAIKKTTKEVFAVKIMEKHKLSPSAIDNVVSEIGLLKRLKHPHIVEMRDFLWDQSNVYIVMEYCNAGNLSSYIKANKTLPESTCKTFLQQLAVALRYMRAHDVSHLDLKPANLLLHKTANKYVLKVADFGFAQRLKLNQENTAVKGSPLYMAPEILISKSYGPAADLWSVGVILYECLFGKPPYSSASVQELAGRIQDNSPISIPQKPTISADCRKLLRHLLQRNPNERITFEQFFEDAFLNLKCVPNDENLEKAIQLIKHAIKMDEEHNISAAYRLYCQALQYFVPITLAETDQARKRILRQRVQTYLNRAEALKNIVHAKSASSPSSSSNAITSAVHKDTVFEPSTGRKMSEPTNAETDEPERMLAYLSRNFEDVARGFEIVRKAIDDALENKLDEALEGFTAALGILIPALEVVSPAPHKKLLQQKIVRWMEEAEHIKSMRSAQIMEEVENAEAYHPVCVVQ
uniref:Serine/threonine-protein kinase ULK3 n=1 Tax=Anopheles darlingi TaxID=43151 RepID=A0A2M4CVL5_ANODA